MPASLEAFPVIPSNVSAGEKGTGRGPSGREVNDRRVKEGEGCDSRPRGI